MRDSKEVDGMQKQTLALILRAFSLALIVTAAFLLVCGALLFARSTAGRVYAAPIPPPAGYPKLSLSTKSVQPALAHTGGATLQYQIKILNTGAAAATGAILADLMPAHTSYQGDAQATAGTTNVSGTLLTWKGDVGFDSSVLISFSVKVDVAFAGTITNTAVISHPQIAHPVSVTAQTVVTDQPIFAIKKSGSPQKPGPGKPLTYALEVTNLGQPASSLPVNVTDKLPADTTFLKAGPDGQASPDKRTVSWQRTLDLDTGASSVFTYSVTVADVPSGTVLTNDQYQVSSTPTGVAYGQPYTLTVVDPEFFISKITWPDPPGSNREMTYTLTVLNRGSLATNLKVTDQLPTGVTYRRGGSLQNGVVQWTLPQLDSGQKADFSYTVYVGDVAEVPILNSNYKVCSAEGVCKAGPPLTSLVKGPTFQADLWLDPIAKKPGGGNSPVTPTLVLKNLGPGSALDASAMMYFRRISVQYSDLLQYPALGQFFYGPDCGDKCTSYRWVGDLAAGQAVTLTTSEGQNSVGGEEGTHYTATVVMTDQLGTFTTAPYTATVFGLVTHYAHLIPSKSAPPVIGAGQVMTYNLKVFNSGLSTETDAAPTLTDTIPASTTLKSVSDGGTSSVKGGRTVVAWNLPALSTGDSLYRSFAVQVNPDLVSGTQLINNDYWTRWHQSGITGTGVLSNTGEPVTTTVREVGLIDSFKVVTPTLARPGPGNVLTYTLHVVNTSPVPLYGVSLYDIMPWEHATYRRDAVASAGNVISDIVSLGWNGDVMPNSQQLITFSVLVDSDFSGVITNTATITHTSLRAPVKISARAYITNQPVLSLSKSATPDPVSMGGELLYTLHVQNLGQQATVLVLTDTVPANTSFVTGSATAGGQLVGDQVHWVFPLLEPGETRNFSFRVKVLGGTGIVNDHYRVSSAEGASAIGAPVYTRLSQRFIFFPVTLR
jgi:uncharacterized repeat protein (TIGR01451 family)